MDVIGLLIKHISAITFNIRRMQRYNFTQMVLCKNFDSKIVFENFDIRIFVNSIRNAIDEMKRSGVEAKAAQLDRGNYMEFIVRIPKEAN